MKTRPIINTRVVPGGFYSSVLKFVPMGKASLAWVADIYHYFIFIIISQTLTEEFIPCIDLLTTFKMEEIC